MLNGLLKLIIENSKAEVALPRYDYECDECSHKFEVRQSFDSKPVAECPKCQARASRKFHAVPIMFKGSGWYVNDYGKRGGTTKNTESGDSKEPAKKPDAEKSGTTGATESKSSSEVKPTKSETSTKAK